MKPVDETLSDHDNHLLPHGDDDHPLPHDDYSLFPVPSSSNPSLEPNYTSVAVGSELYVFGGYYDAPSSAVRILDCRSHTWRDGPSMLFPRWYWRQANAFLLDEKIYVMGGWGSDEPLDWIEVWDVKTQTWRHVRSHGVDEVDKHRFVTNVFKGKMYAIAEKKSCVYDPQQSKWEVVHTHSNFGFINDWCAVEDVMYCFAHSGYCMWYDSKAGDWIGVMGSDLELLRMHRTCGLAWSWALKVSNLGGKLLVMWIPESESNKRVSFKKKESNKREAERRIWCAKIALEKRGTEVWGKIEWANSVSDSCRFSSCVVSV
ncbi:F-box/kelch-repeat protein [Raphanus sativus]|nr:F-box/kelch-repeat protein [Raphanus sativus]